MKRPTKKAKPAETKAPEPVKQAAPKPVEPAPAKKPDPREPRPMPDNFASKLKFELEGSRMVARQDGVEVAYSQTDDKKAAAEAEQGAAQSMWDALEGRRVRALGDAE